MFAGSFCEYRVRFVHSDAPHFIGDKTMKAIYPATTIDRGSTSRTQVQLDKKAMAQYEATKATKAAWAQG